MKKLIFFTILIYLISFVVYAGTFDGVFTDKVKSEVRQSFEIIENDFISSIDAIEMIERLNEGDYTVEFSRLPEYIKNGFLNELKGNFNFFLKITVIILLVSLVENMSENISGKSILAISCSSVVVLNLIDVFYDISGYATQTIDRLILFINSLTPTLLTTLAGSGRVVSAGMLNPIMLGVSSVITLIIKSVLIPLITVGLALKLTVSVTDKRHLLNLGNQIYSLVKWLTGFMLTLYAGIIAVVGAAAPSVDEITLKTAKYAVGSFVPYVGSMLSDSVELVLNCSSVVKNSIGIVGLIGILTVVALPCLKIVVKILLFNLLSVLVAPVSGKGVLDALNNISSCLNILLGFVFVVSVMYILSITVIIYVGGA